MVVSRYTRLGLGAIYLFLTTPVARATLEATMGRHMLVQIPLLAAAGVIAARWLPERCKDSLLAACGGALPCVVVALFASSYWMLPRALDAALANPLAELAKFITLPALVGLPLALAWQRLSVIGRGFVWTNFISMLAVLGWLYIAAPVRVCNSYLVDEQGSTGWLMVKLSILLFTGWLATLFVGGAPMLTERNCLRLMEGGVERKRSPTVASQKCCQSTSSSIKTLSIIFVKGTIRFSQKN